MCTLHEWVYSDAIFSDRKPLRSGEQTNVIMYKTQ